MNNLNDIFFAPTENGALTYEQVLEDVQRYFSENHASTIAGAGENDSERAVTVLKELMVQYLVKRKYAIKGLTTEQLCARLYEDMAGYSFKRRGDICDTNYNLFAFQRIHKIAAKRA